jgi:hypothetical protein
MDVSAPTWDDVRLRLETALAALPDGGFVVLGEPAPVRPKPTGLRGKFGGRGAPVPTRFVQARRDGDQLGVECVGAAAFGGPLVIAPETDARLRALGWLAPGDATYEPMGGPAYRRWIAVAETAAAATLLVASLEELGTAPSAPLELTTGS